MMAMMPTAMARLTTRAQAQVGQLAILRPSLGVDLRRELDRRRLPTDGSGRTS